MMGTPIPRSFYRGLPVIGQTVATSPEERKHGYAHFKVQRAREAFYRRIRAYQDAGAEIAWAGERFERTEAEWGLQVLTMSVPLLRAPAYSPEGEDNLEAGAAGGGGSKP